MATGNDVTAVQRALRQCADLADGSTWEQGKLVAWKCGCRCRSALAHALRVAEQAHTFIASRSEGGPQGKGDHSDPTFTLAYPAVSGVGSFNVPTRVDPSPLWLEQLSHAVLAAAPVLLDLNRVLQVLARIESPEALRATGSGFCMVEGCARYAPGGPDRLRGGYCGACHSAWQRAQAKATETGSAPPDRFTFNRQRTAFLTSKPEVA